MSIKLKKLEDIVCFINYDAIDFSNENRNFLREVVAMYGCLNFLIWLDIDIVYYPQFDSFILKSLGRGKNLQTILNNIRSSYTLKSMKLTVKDIAQLKTIVDVFNLDLKIEKEKGIYRAYLCGKNLEDYRKEVFLRDV